MKSSVRQFLNTMTRTGPGIGILLTLLISRNLFAGEPAICGPERTTPGTLCVFTLDHEGPADWYVLPELPFHTDHDGRTIVFAPEQNTTYHVVAAVILRDPDPITESAPVDGTEIRETGSVPKILVHECLCAEKSEPEPSPDPDLTPVPPPSPQPQSLRGWIVDHLPAELQSQAPSLADVYETVAGEIDRGMIRSRDAAFAAIRSGTLVSVNRENWKTFLDALSVRLYQERKSDSTLTELASLFREIASGLRSTSTRNATSTPGGISSAGPDQRDTDRMISTPGKILSGMSIPRYPIYPSTPSSVPSSTSSSVLSPVLSSNPASVPSLSPGLFLIPDSPFPCDSGPCGIAPGSGNFQRVWKVQR
ncbi:MAG: hypothetical protein Q4C47_08080 [Planctomycetia bacterium]|nr:hypothetical protein [Planctomycetia bacterium]